MNRLAVLLLTVVCAPLLGPACIDTTLPDLSGELGSGRTTGPICSPEKIENFPPEELRITLIDVGQGDAIWIQTPYYTERELESLDILIDAGSAGDFSGQSPGGAVVVDYLFTHGMAPGGLLDALVITHAHEDHYGGVPAVVNSFEIGRYVDPGFTANSSGFVGARNAAESDAARYGNFIHVPAVPDLVPRPFVQTDLFGQYVSAYLLWAASTPPSGNASNPSGTDINNTSAAFAIKWGAAQVLLTGDLEQEVEDQLVAAHDAGEIDLRSSVLKVAHHGSSSSSGLEFLARVFPAGGDYDWAVISSGRKSFGGVTLPTDQTLANLNAVLADRHILSTEHDDDIKPAGTEHGDDHIVVTIDAGGLVSACYAQ